MSDPGDVRLGQGLGVLVAVGALVYGVAAAPPAGVEREVQLVLSVFVATVVLWITRPVPYVVSSLLCVILLFGLGITDTFRDAVTGFGSTLVFFFLLLYLVGTSVSKVDLDEWIARRLVSTTTTPRRSVRRLSSAILLLAFVMPSGFARTITFIPVVDGVNDLYELDPDSGFRRFGYYLLGHVNPIASMALMTGGGMPVVTAELIDDMVRPITWVEWAVYMIPPVIALYAVCLLAASRFVGVDDALELDPEDDRPVDTDATDPSRDADPLTREQWIVTVVLALAVVAWIVGSFLGVPAIIPAMGAVLIYSLPGVGIITAEEIRDVNWGIIFLIGAMLSLLDAMQAANAIDRLLETMLFVVPAGSSNAVAFVVVFLIAILVRGTFSSSAAAMVVIFPITLEFAVRFGFDPLFTAFGSMMLMITTVFLPFNLPTVLVAHETGPLSVVEVFGLGVLTLAAGALVVAGSWLFYWPLVDGLLAGSF